MGVTFILLAMVLPHRLILSLSSRSFADCRAIAKLHSRQIFLEWVAFEENIWNSWQIAAVEGRIRPSGIFVEEIKRL